MEKIDGRELSLSVKTELRGRVESLRALYGRVPCLAAVIVGDDPASRIYVRGKMKAAQFVGIDSRLLELPSDCSEEALLDVITRLNADSGVDGVLVQLPLPEHIRADKVIDAVSIGKDVDGFHPRNVAGLQLGRECTVPCTPKGIIRMIESTGRPIAGARAVVVGRSNIVGKPVAKLLLDRNATVTVAHSHTSDLGSITREADILVVAAGHPGLVDGDMVKPGAVVIDVGINRCPDGKVVGDVDFESASRVASFISPVPGGVGSMTIAMLLSNTVECFLRNADPVSRDDSPL